MLSNRRIQTKVNGRLRKLLLCVVALLALMMMFSAVIGLYCILTKQPSFPVTGALQFDSGVWKAPTSEDDRWEMLADLRAKHLKQGTPKSQLEILLGPPQTTADAAEVYGARKGDFLYSYYDVGRREDAFDGTYLILIFDNQWRLIRAEIFSN